MSKLTNWFVEKFGADKVLHFLGGGWITSILSLFGWYGVIGGVIITFIISYVKERWLDVEFDKADIIAAMFGSMVSVICYSMFRLLQ